jgi:hypothetical protein
MIAIAPPVSSSPLLLLCRLSQRQSHPTAKALRRWKKKRKKKRKKHHRGHDHPSNLLLHLMVLHWHQKRVPQSGFGRFAAQLKNVRFSDEQD